MAKAGYFGGNPSNVLKADSDIVLATLEYHYFDIEKEVAFKMLNEVVK